MNDRIALDILEIQSLLAAYVYAIDDKAFDRLDDVFTPDALIDYTATGGVSGKFGQIKNWLARALAGFPQTQHLLGLPLITVNGNTACARTMLFNPMQPANGPLFFCGATYSDELVRTENGWRIARRTETDAWFKDPPAAGPVPRLEE